MSEPGHNIKIFDTVAQEFEAQRNKSLFERSCLDRMLATTEVKTVLDIGCGPGVPVARYLVNQGVHITGVDSSPAMIDLFRKNLPGADAHVCDMVTLELNREFDAVLVFDSFFFLDRESQRMAFPRIAHHVRSGGVLMVNTGPEEAEGQGWAVEGAPAYHASLSPEEYRALFVASGLTVLEFSPNDRETGRSMWLARRGKDEAVPTL